jgi:hypothetical protein
VRILTRFERRLTHHKELLRGPFTHLQINQNKWGMSGYSLSCETIKQ